MAISEEDYQMQLFDMSLQDVVSGVRETLLENIEKALQSILRKLARNVFPPETLGSRREDLLAVIRASVDNNMAELKEIVRVHFEIPPEVILPTDEIHTNNIELNCESNLDHRLRAAHINLVATQLLESQLEEVLERSILDELKVDVDQVKSNVADLEEASSALKEELSRTKLAINLLN